MTKPTKKTNCGVRNVVVVVVRFIPIIHVLYIPPTLRNREREGERRRKR